VHSPHAYERIALGGTIGAGESYMAGEWSCDKPDRSATAAGTRQEAMFALERGLARLTAPLQRAGHCCATTRCAAAAKTSLRITTEQRVLRAVSR